VRIHFSLELICSCFIGIFFPRYLSITRLLSLQTQLHLGFKLVSLSLLESSLYPPYSHLHQSTLNLHNRLESNNKLVIRNFPFRTGYINGCNQRVFSIVSLSTLGTSCSPSYGNLNPSISKGFLLENFDLSRLSLEKKSLLDVTLKLLTILD
jgi:hypothetical protein